MTTKAYAGRVDETTAALIEQALEEEGISASAFISRAVECYIERNPDDISAFYSTGSVDEFMDALLK